MCRRRFHSIKTTALAYCISNDIIPAAFIHSNLERKLRSLFSHKCYYVGNSITASESVKAHNPLCFFDSMTKTIRCNLRAAGMVNKFLYFSRKETVSHPFRSLNIATNISLGEKRFWYFLSGLWGPCVPLSSLLSSPSPAGEHPLCFQEVL